MNEKQEKTNRKKEAENLSWTERKKSQKKNIE